MEELASPYFEWRLKGFEVTIASIKGGEIPFDDASKTGDFCTPEAKNFLNDSELCGPARCAPGPLSLPYHVPGSNACTTDSPVFLPCSHALCRLLKASSQIPSSYYRRCNTMSLLQLLLLHAWLQWHPKLRLPTSHMHPCLGGASLQAPPWSW